MPQTWNKPSKEQKPFCYWTRLIISLGFVPSSGTLRFVSGHDRSPTVTGEAALREGVCPA